MHSWAGQDRGGANKTTEAHGRRKKTHKVLGSKKIKEETEKDKNKGTQDVTDLILALLNLKDVLILNAFVFLLLHK